ncbi:hypothetical protein [Streptomyces acidiscabies]|uniref:hypothetical protein n=1 Tax=Streptomyces acidiscabies TaxID=42234 RepID=UPI000AC0094C|nr:hypothetical protein [Streptomyces acidiscabies]
MRSARSMLATAFGLAALTVTGLGTTSASATIPHSDSPKYVTVEGHKVVAGTTIGE